MPDQAMVNKDNPFRDPDQEFKASIINILEIFLDDGGWKRYGVNATATQLLYFLIALKKWWNLPL